MNPLSTWIPTAPDFGRGRSHVRAYPCSMNTKQRLDAIEARQRRYRQHDDSCATLPAGDSLVLVNADCDCWLSKPAEDGKAKKAS